MTSKLFYSIASSREGVTNAGTRSLDVSLGSGAVVEHDGAVSVSGTPQQAVLQQ